MKTFIVCLCVVFFSIVSQDVFSTGPGNSTAHNQLQRVTTGSTTTHNNYRPKVRIAHGCQPFSAVDDAGNYNAGLKDAGSHNGGCSSSPSAITYSRAKCVRRSGSNWCGYMYVYYMPKDNGVPVPSFGHRHDFEEIVVWVRDGNIIGASYSAHGDYIYDNNPYLSNGRVNAQYEINGVTHSMGRISNNRRGRGTVYQNARWNNLTSNAKQALNDTSNFPTAVFAARNDNFSDKLNEARISAVVNANVVY